MFSSDITKWTWGQSHLASRPRRYFYCSDLFLYFQLLNLGFMPWCPDDEGRIIYNLIVLPFIIKVDCLKVLTRDSVTISVDAVVYYRQFLSTFPTCSLSSWSKRPCWPYLLPQGVQQYLSNNICPQIFALQGVQLNNVQNIGGECSSFYLTSLSGFQSSYAVIVKRFEDLLQINKYTL